MYAPPEMLLFPEICPFKADIWALGITYFYMATCEYLFVHTTKDELKLLIYNGEIDFDSYEIHPKIRFLLVKMTIKDYAKKSLNFNPKSRINSRLQTIKTF